MTSEATKRFALLGYPVAQSKSPVMHRAAFTAMGLPHSYEALKVSSDDLPLRVQELRLGRFHGLNVTLPYKQSVLALVDRVDFMAEAIGAANTLVRTQSDATTEIRAYNTDIPALGEELLDLFGTHEPLHASASASASGSGSRSRSRSAIVLGSGGAARCAVAAAFLYMGVARVHIRARSFADATQAKRFKADMENALTQLSVAEGSTTGSGCTVVVEDLQLSAAELTQGAGHKARIAEMDCVCILQATSAGMVGAESGDAVINAIAWSALPASCVAIDVVYNPAITPFLRAAESAGIRCKGGIGMLARQGALALELWLGTPAPFNAMLAALT
jgi:shikimate dehydrogenase